MEPDTENYLTCDGAWLRALTRERRLDRALEEFRQSPVIECVRFSAQGDEFTQSIDVFTPVVRYKSRAKAWRQREWKAGNRHCYYCRDRMCVQGKHVPCWHPKIATVDHKEPLALGGDDEPWNYAMACWTCNNRKGSMTEAEFRAVLGVAVAAE